MTRARSALLLFLAVLTIGIAAVLFWQPFDTAHVDPGGPVDRVVLVVEDRVSFEQLMSDQLFRNLASGGVALMTTHTGSGLEWANQRTGGPGQAKYYAIEYGATDAEPALPPLSGALSSAGIDVCSFFDPGSVGVRGGPTNLFAVPGDDGPIEECPHDPSSTGRRLVVVDDGATLEADVEEEGAGPPPGLAEILDREASIVEQATTQNSANANIAVIVVTPSPSFEMDRRGDEVTPLILAVGSTEVLVGRRGKPFSLTSDTTRQPGLVANVDVAPTILRLFGLPPPTEMVGQPIHAKETTDVAHLHRIHLDQRRIRIPFQLGLIAYVSFLAMLAIGTLIWLRLGHPLPTWVTSGMRFLIVCGVALMIPLMAGGLLPRLTYVVVVPFVVLSSVALAFVAVRANWPGTMGPFAFLGAAALAFLLVDGLFGWRGLRIPLLGATMFDGVRFYGIPNAFLATLLGSGLFLAVLLPPWPGAVLLFGAGLFAGFPALGADLGGAATLFFAAGLWWAVRSPHRPVAERVLAVPAAALIGLTAVVLANRLLPGAPTHIAGFVERGGSGLSGVWQAFTRRLDVGVGQFQDVPAAWLPMLGLPVILITAIVRPEPIRSGFAVGGEVWREALVVLTLAAMASFFANDTGVAAAAPAFLYAATAMAYPAYVSRRAP